jgi:hypothetical protein
VVLRSLYPDHPSTKAPLVCNAIRAAFFVVLGAATWYGDASSRPLLQGKAIKNSTEMVHALKQVAGVHNAVVRVDGRKIRGRSSAPPFDRMAHHLPTEWYTTRS